MRLLRQVLHRAPENAALLLRSVPPQGYRKQPGRPAHAAGQGAVLRFFTCARCGRVILVTDENDRRRKFCSPHCERMYWKHKKKSGTPRTATFGAAYAGHS